MLRQMIVIGNNKNGYLPLWHNLDGLNWIWKKWLYKKVKREITGPCIFALGMWSLF